MKTSNLFISILSSCLILTGCQKDPATPAPPPVNKVPVVKVIAGESVQINTAPGLDTVQISGSASDSDGTIKSYIYGARFQVQIRL